MASDAPWTKWFHDDFLQGCAAANLTAEEIGVYAVVLSLIASRGGPIEDDRRWIAGRAGLSVRRLNQIMDRLGDIPNKLVIRNDMIGNHKMLGVVKERDKKSAQARDAAHARWHGDEAELPLGSPISPRSPTLSQDKVALYPEIISPKNEQNPQKSANSDDADASSLRARARTQRLRDSERIIQPTESLTTPRERPGDRSPDPVVEVDPAPIRQPDLKALLDQCSEASGYFPVSPGQITASIDQVKAWRDDGIDFEAVVLPTIRQLCSASSDPTSSLKRFDRQVRHEHARHGNAKLNGSAPPTPLPDPITRFDDESPEIEPIRRAMLKRMGRAPYAASAHSVRLEIAEGHGPHQRVLYAHQRGRFSAFWDGNNPAMMRTIAQAHGLADAWKGR